MKTIDEILDKYSRIPEGNGWYDEDVWKAMEEYADQFKASQSSVTEEEIIAQLKRLFIDQDGYVIAYAAKKIKELISVHTVDNESKSANWRKDNLSHRPQVSKEELIVSAFDWLLKQEIIISGGDYYFESDEDGDHRMNGADLYRIIASEPTKNE